MTAIAKHRQQVSRDLRMGWGGVHRSSSSCFRTSPIICPTLCNALMLSSVWSYSFCKPLMSSRKFLSFASHSRDSMSLALNDARACWRSWSDDIAARLGGFGGARQGDESGKESWICGFGWIRGIERDVFVDGVVLGLLWDDGVDQMELDLEAGRTC